MKVNIRKKIYIFFSECPISTSQWTYGNVSEVQRLFECPKSRTALKEDDFLSHPLNEIRHLHLWQ